MSREEEKKNQRIAMFTSIGVHVGLFLMFFFMIAWRPPNPPLPEIGLEVNFGTDDQGTGDVQPDEPVGSQGTQPEEPNQPEEQEELPETPKPVETKVEEQQVVSKVESPVSVKETKEEKQPEKPVEKVQPKKEEPVKPTPDKAAEYKPSTPKTESNNTTTDGKAGNASSHGDDKNKTGDKGHPEGKPDANSLYGNPGGGGGGPSLELAGWQWDRKPVPNVAKSESGRVVFEIKVDENGDIVNIKTLERSVSIEAEQACRQEIQKLTFTKTGTNVPEFSTGKITFVITTR
jgi:periplasmic protein TonB